MTKSPAKTARVASTGRQRRNSGIDVMAAPEVAKTPGSRPKAAKGGGPKGPALRPASPQPNLDAKHQRLTAKTAAQHGGLFCNDAPAPSHASCADLIRASKHRRCAWMAGSFPGSSPGTAMTADGRVLILPRNGEGAERSEADGGGPRTPPGARGATLP
jgi:hypothetical protein